MTLEEQLNREVHFITNMCHIELEEHIVMARLIVLQVQKQSMISHNAQDSQALWEEELKSRSRLGLRLSELEKEKGELTNQVPERHNNVLLDS